MFHLTSRVLASLSLVVAATSCGPLLSQTSNRAPLTSADVIATLAQAGVHVDARQIQMPGLLTTASKETQLHVTQVDLLPEARLRVRLSCRPAPACQPFVATVQETSVAEARNAIDQLQESLEPTRTAREIAPGSRVLAGQHATLLLEDTHMRIQLPVLVVDNGTIGTEVRVSSLDHKQLYRAVVTDAGTVRGVLP